MDLEVRESTGGDIMVSSLGTGATKGASRSPSPCPYVAPHLNPRVASGAPIRVAGRPGTRQSVSVMGNHCQQQQTTRKVDKDYCFLYPPPGGDKDLTGNQEALPPISLQASPSANTRSSPLPTGVWVDNSREVSDEIKGAGSTNSNNCRREESPSPPKFEVSSLSTRSRQVRSFTPTNIPKNPASTLDVDYTQKRARTWVCPDTPSPPLMRVGKLFENNDSCRNKETKKAKIKVRPRHLNIVRDTGGISQNTLAEKKHQNGDGRQSDRKGLTRNLSYQFIEMAVENRPSLQRKHSDSILSALRGGQSRDKKTPSGRFEPRPATVATSQRRVVNRYDGRGSCGNFTKTMYTSKKGNTCERRGNTEGFRNDGIIDGVVDEEKKERIIQWLIGVENCAAEAPPIVDIVPEMPPQTDTAIHIVYKGD